MGRPPLWVVQRDGATVYLYGVRPIMGAEPWLTAMVRDAVANSAVFWRETPRIEDVAFDPLVAQRGLSREVPLRDRLDDETNRRIDAVATGAGLDPRTLDVFRPWLAVQVLRHAVCDPIHSGPTMDDVLTDVAAAAGATINYEFADAEHITRLFSELPPDVEIDLLRMELDELEPGADAMRDRFRRAIAGDLSFEEAGAHRVSEAYPEMYERLLVQRNRAWIPRIENALASGMTTFIAVGTMHVVGPNNVRSLLREDVRLLNG